MNPAPLDAEHKATTTASRIFRGIHVVLRHIRIREGCIETEKAATAGRKNDMEVFDIKQRHVCQKKEKHEAPWTGALLFILVWDPALSLL